MKSDLHRLCERLLENLKKQRALEEQQQAALNRALLEGGDDAVLFEAHRALNALNPALSGLETEEGDLKRDIDAVCRQEMGD